MSLNMEPFQITLIAAFVLALLELLTGAFFFLGMAVGALVVCGVQWMAGDWSFNRDLLIFAVSATVAFAGFRRFFHRARDQQLAHDDVNQY